MVSIIEYLMMSDTHQHQGFLTVCIMYIVFDQHAARFVDSFCVIPVIMAYQSDIVSGILSWHSFWHIF